MTTNKVCLIFLARRQPEIVAPFVEAFCDIGVDAEVISLPYFSNRSLNSKRLRSLQALVDEKSRTAPVIFFPNSNELFLRNVDHHLTFSGYRGWNAAFSMSVIPHLWTPVRMPDDTKSLRWDDKPPLRVGFMGRSHSVSKIATLLCYCPQGIKRWLLRADYLRYPELLALAGDFGLPLANINAFARIETLRTLRFGVGNFPEVELDFVERDFVGSATQTQEYARHLQRNTYIICPRGMENFSYRTYEALSFGRIPVIIDTGVMLPPEIDWERLSLIVPYNSLGRIHELILEHYNSRTADSFIAVQDRAIDTMSRLQKLEWIKDLAVRISAHIFGHSFVEPKL